MLFELLIKFCYLFAGNGVHTVIVVAECGIFTLDFKIGYKPRFFVSYAANLCIFNCRERIGKHAHTRNAERHKAVNICVVKSHLRFFICVFIVHIVDLVHGVCIHSCKPRAVNIEKLGYLVIVKIFALIALVNGAYLNKLVFVHTAVERHQKKLCKVCSCTEELHLLAYLHCRNAAGNRVIIAVYRAHKVVVFILNSVCITRNLGTKMLEVLRQIL